MYVSTPSSSGDLPPPGPGATGQDTLGPDLLAVIARLNRWATSQPTMTAQVQRAETDGWVQRVADPQDGRASLIDLTAAGRRVLEGARRARGAVLAPHLARLDRRERETLRRAIDLIERIIPAP